jgi:hypothetical protein
MALSVQDIILNIANGIDWVTKELAKARLDVVEKMADALNDPKWGGVTLVGLIAGSTLLEVAWNLFSQLDIVKTVRAFIENISTAIKNVLSLMQVDLLLTLFLLGKTFDPAWQQSLAAIYTALGNVAKEINLDFSFINAFAEANRSILYTAASLSGNSWILSQSNYADGLVAFLGTLQGRLKDYIDNPDLIFIDLAHTISEGRTGQVDTIIGNIWAAIDYGAAWIIDSGNKLITGVDDLYEQIGNFPDEVQAAIHAQVDPYKADFDAFVNNQWAGFQIDYGKANDIVNAYLLDHGIRIDQIEAKINDPLDLLFLFFSLDDSKKKETRDYYNEFWDSQKIEEETAAIVAVASPIEDIVTQAVELTKPPDVVREEVPTTTIPLYIAALTGTKPSAWYIADGYTFSMGNNPWFVGEEK